MDPYTDHATEIAPALLCLSGGVTHKGKVVENIPELEATEEVQDRAMGMGSINLQTHGLSCQEDFMGSITDRLITCTPATAQPCTPKCYFLRQCQSLPWKQ